MTHELMNLPRTVAEARLSGSKRYFTGVSCRHGHVAFRWTVSRKCSLCTAIELEQYREMPDFRRRELSQKRNTHRIKYATDEAYVDDARRRAREQKKRIRESPELLSVHRIRSRVFSAIRRARGGVFERGKYAKLVEDLFLQQKGLCAYCRLKITKEKSEIDHFIPVSKGGLTSFENLRLSCLPCNRSKGATMPNEFMLRLRLRTTAKH